MNRFLGLLLLGLVVLVIAFFIYNPRSLENIWMWVVGFIGYVIYFLRKGAQSIKELFSGQGPSRSVVLEEKKATQTGVPLTQLNQKEPDISSLERLLSKVQHEEEGLSQSDLTVLRYLDDGLTTLGLLFIDGRFFAYTLEDTHRDEKISGNTRIPEGRYPLSYNQNLTELTQRYRKRFPWFEYHIEIKNIPNYDLVYIHIGNTHQDTRGCILLADGVNTASKEKMVTHSQKAYERFYQAIYPRVSSNTPLSIQILDESWVKRATIKTKHLQAVPQT
ncbi:MAG: DUF5675 family protein [Cyclobacterium sp.]|uniref:DUF5675 family protein n=1 Tax=unclassified Cyclobacterium TaxID=2615055 RepID=UPI0013D4CE16|nr:DUF5675 family protein [Cyclobacterium sp. SYSU L10401]